MFSDIKFILANTIICLEGRPIITVRFISALQDYVPAAEVKVKYYPGLTVRTILEEYKLPAGQVGLVLVDQKAETVDCALKDNSTVELYPIFGGG